MTPEQRTALQQLAAQFPQFDRAVRWANGDESRPVTGTTPPNVVSVHDAWEKARIKNAKTVLSGAGITRAEITNADVSAIATKVTTWINAQTAAQRPLFTIRASAFFALLFEKLADGVLDTNEDATHDIGSQPIPGDTWAVTHGFPNGITEEMLREALQ